MNKTPRIIDIKALIKCMLEMWKIVAALSALLAVLLGGVKGFQTFRTMRNSETAVEEEISEAGATSAAAEDAENTEVSSEKTLTVFDDALNAKRYYAEHSLKMQIDPYREGRATVDIIVDIPMPSSEGETTTSDAMAEYSDLTLRENNILDYYVTTATDRIDFTELAQEMETEPVYLEELVSVTKDEQATNKATVQVIYFDEEGARRILDYVTAQLTAVQEQAQAEYEPHTVKLVNESVATVVDKEQYAFVNTRINEINSLYSSIDQLEGYVGTSSGSSDVTVQIGMGDVIKAFVKYAVVGFFAGVVVLEFLYAVVLLLAGSVLSGRELDTQYSLQKIACIPSKRRVRERGIDRLIARIDGKYYSNSSVQECYQVAAALISRMDIPGNRVAVVSDLPAEYLAQVIEKLQRAGGRRRIEYIAVPFLEETQDTVNAFIACDAVVLVAARKVSSYRNVSDILERVESYEKPVLGSVVIG